MSHRRRQPTKLRFAGLIAASALLAASCSSSHRTSPTTTSSTRSGATTITTTTRPRPAARLEPASCNEILHEVGRLPESTVTCNFLVVPEDRSKPQGRTVRLAVALLHTHASKPAADPVVYLHGGPGIGTLADGIGSRLSSPVLDTRDLILFDQRGTGSSQPDLECPEREQAFVDLLAKPKPFPTELAAFDTAITACHDRLTASGVDLAQYNTVQNVEDLEDLRIALGVRRWNLWGTSYGTRLALAAMRTHPTGIRSAVLDSVYPPSAGGVDDAVQSATRAVEALVNGCGTDPACHQAFPDVSGDIDKMISRLDRQPYSFTYKPPETTASRRLRVSGAVAASGLFNAMYSTEVIAQLPAIIHQVAGADYTLIPAIAESAIPFVNQTSEGAYLSVECADNGARVDEARVAALRADPGRAAVALLASWNLFCRDWPVEPLPRGFGEVVHSDIPTLVIAGEYDPTTPASQSKAAAQALKHSVYVEVPRGGHVPQSVCAATVFGKFFDQLDRVDASCATTTPPIPFGTG